MDDDRASTELLGEVHRAVDLGPRVGGPPHPLGEQQSRGMNGKHGYVVAGAERCERGRVLADRVGPDHDLDTVIPQSSGELEGGLAPQGNADAVDMMTREVRG